MELTSKQRAYLKSLASTLNPVFQIGKSSVTPEITAAVEQCFNNNELIKLNVLKNCDDEVHEIANVIADRTRSTLVQVIGKKIVLYKPFKEKQKIILP